MPPTIDPRKAFPRRFVPPDADAGRWAEIERIGTALVRRTPRSVEELREWVAEAGELAACVSEAGARLYIAMTSQTDDPERERAFLDFVREVRPRWRALSQRLDEAYLHTPHRAALPAYYHLLDRRVETRVALYREENLPLKVREEELGQQYQKLRGAMTVVYRGREHTLQEMARYLQDPDRAIRQETWALTQERWGVEREAMEGLFDQLREVRLAIARNAGFVSYRDYAFRALQRFDYGPAECRQFQDAVAALFVPLAGEIIRERQRLLAVDTMRPWDLEVDPLRRPPLPEFERTADLLDRCEAVFGRVRPEFGEFFQFMREEGLLDLERRKGKAPGGYQQTLAERRVPFIFANVAPAEDVRTLLHEAGHAFHALAAREQALLAYRDAPIEFAEVASQGMELLSASSLGTIYPEAEDARRALRALLEGILMPKGMPWIATVDAFQHWLYTHADHTPKERRAAWLSIHRRFIPWLDWSGHEEALASSWHAQLHIFLLPFYYIEYGVAQQGALQIWLRAAQASPIEAVEGYRAALALGGSRPLPDLFAAAGARFAFDEETMAPLARALGEALAQVPYGRDDTAS
ncbi:MAG TPA: M3 family oligoendopeptidase [bacterium]|nr:M3 family oligoendopeptidase [bacterium]